MLAIRGTPAATGTRPSAAKVHAAVAWLPPALRDEIGRVLLSGNRMPQEVAGRKGALAVAFGVALLPYIGGLVALFGAAAAVSGLSRRSVHDWFQVASPITEGIVDRTGLLYTLLVGEEVDCAH